MRWEQMQSIEAGKLRRLVGVSPAVFEAMRQAALAGEPASSHPVGGARRGRKPKLDIEDRLLMLLMDYREYRTFAHLGASFGLSEAQSWRILTTLEARLLRDGRFPLERKARLQSETRWAAVIVEVGEHAVERPQRSSVPATRARRSATP
jgi:hypothetical protein